MCPRSDYGAFLRQNGGLGLRTKIFLWVMLSVLCSPALSQTGAVQIDRDLWAAMAEAVATHPSVSAARISAKAAGLDVKEAKWRRFPSVSVEGLLRAGRGDTIQPQAVIDQPIWTGGRITSNIRKSSARKSAALAGYDEATQSIALDVVESYHSLIRLHFRHNILMSSLGRHRDMAGSMERRVSSGTSPVSDLELARARTLQVEQQVVSARAQEIVSLQRLRSFIGDDSYNLEFSENGQTACPALNMVAITTDSLVYSPTLRRLRFQAKEAAADADIVRASTLPQVSSQYSYDEIFGHRVGLVFRAQTDGGLSRLAAVEAADLRRRASDLQILAAEQNLRNQTVADFEDYTSNCERMMSGGNAAASARHVTDSYLRQFANGRRSWLDVMNAVREATAAEIDTLDASSGRSAAFSRIMLRTGAWQPAGERAQP